MLSRSLRLRPSPYICLSCRQAAQHQLRCKSSTSKKSTDDHADQGKSATNDNAQVKARGGSGPAALLKAIEHNSKASNKKNGGRLTAKQKQEARQKARQERIQTRKKERLRASTAKEKPRKESRLVRSIKEALLSKDEKRRSKSSVRTSTTREERRAALKEATTLRLPEELQDKLRKTKEATEAPQNEDKDEDRKTLIRNVQSSSHEKASDGQSPDTSPFAATADVETVDADRLDFDALDIERLPVPGLSYGLDRVLFNPGVYQLQDPRTKVYNFDPYLQMIMPVAEFDFNALKQYITSSKDTTMPTVASKYGKKYVGSTSSMTGTLAQFHYLLSAWRDIEFGMLSKNFPIQSTRFTNINRAPTATFLRYQPETNTYAIDADKEYDSANVLSMLGKSMEKLLTVPKNEFESYRKNESGRSTRNADEESESYHYSTQGDFVMRSQLDAYDKRLPGTGMFDLKTRAVVSIRHNTAEYEHGTGYEIRAAQGQWESYEREYHDMLRSTALKYSLQARMGRMDGIFVAYHNVLRIFGFQYISLPELDYALHGQRDTNLGDKEFKLSVNLLNQILNKATEKLPKQTLRFHFETRDAKVPFMYIFAEPMSDEEADAIQNKNKEDIEEFERKMLGMDKSSSSSPTEIEEGWAEIKAMVEEEMLTDELGEEDVDSDAELYAKLSDFADQITKKRQELEAEMSDNDGDGGELDDLAQEAAEVEAGLARLKEIANQFTAKTQSFKEKLQGQQVENPGLEAVIDQLDEIIDDVREESERFNLQADEEDDVEEDETEQDGEESALQDDELEDEPHETPQGYQNLDESTKSTEEDSSNATDASTGITSPDWDLASGLSDLDSIKQPSSQLPKDASRPSELSSAPHHGKPLFAMTLTIRNKVNDRYVFRPENLHPSHKWTVEYCFSQIDNPGRAWQLYESCKHRRSKVFEDVVKDKDPEHADYYRMILKNMSDNGRAWRAEQDRLEKGVQKVVFEPLENSGLATEAEANGQKKAEVMINGLDDYLGWLYKK